MGFGEFLIRVTVVFGGCWWFSVDMVGFFDGDCESITGLWFWWVVFLFPIVGGDEVVGLGLWFWWLGIVVVGGGGNGICCSYGGCWMVVFFFFFGWWWLAVASCGCGYGCEFAWIEKKVVSLFKERERQMRRERKKHSERIKIIIFKWSCKKNKAFDVKYIVKWCVKINKVVF